MQLAHSLLIAPSLMIVVRELREGGQRLRQLVRLTTHDGLILRIGIGGECGRGGGGRHNNLVARFVIGEYAFILQLLE